MNRFYTLLLLLLCGLGHAKAQGPVLLTLAQCEDQFRKSNLLLLAEQFNIDMSKAAVIQAKIWDQPLVSGEFNAIRPDTRQYFDVGKQGQKALAVQQLIYLGGKKKNEIDFAKSNVDIASLQFEQLLKNLLYQLRESFFSLYFDLKKINSISEQLAQIDTLTAAYQAQALKGNIPLKDVVRLQSLSISLKSDLVTLKNTVFSEQETLKILLNVASPIEPNYAESDMDKRIRRPLILSSDQLTTKALSQNPEYLTLLKVIESNTLFLAWQQALAVPNLTIGGAYDQRGGAFQNQFNITFGIPLPLWNRNKGNIKMAEALVNQSKTIRDQKTLEFTAKINTACSAYIYQQNQFIQMSSSTQQNLEIVYDGVLQNFQKQNISLIEFTDFMESYNQSILLTNDMKKQILIAQETLNYLVNESLF